MGTLIAGTPVYRSVVVSAYSASAAAFGEGETILFSTGCWALLTSVAQIRNEINKIKLRRLFKNQIEQCLDKIVRNILSLG